MTIHGNNVAGASWLQFENRRRGIAINVTTAEPSQKISALIRSVGTAVNGSRASLYLKSDESIAYVSDVLAGFTDTGGSWRDYVFTTTVAVGEYWLTIFADGVPGGGNTIEIAYDSVAADASLYKSWFFDATAWPAQSPDLTDLDSGDGNTQRISLYLQTDSGGGGGASSNQNLSLLGVG